MIRAPGVSLLPSTLQFFKEARSTAPVSTQTAASLKFLLKDTKRNPLLLFSRSLKTLGIWSDAAPTYFSTKPVLYFAVQFFIRSDVWFEVSEFQEVVTCISATHLHECVFLSSFFLRTKARLSLDTLITTNARDGFPELIVFGRAVVDIVKHMLKAAYSTDTKTFKSALHEVVSFSLVYEKRPWFRRIEMTKEIATYCLDLVKREEKHGKSRSPCGTGILRYAIKGGIDSFLTSSCISILVSGCRGGRPGRLFNALKDLRRKPASFDLFIRLIPDDVLNEIGFDDLLKLEVTKASKGNDLQAPLSSARHTAKLPVLPVAADIHVKRSLRKCKKPKAPGTSAVNGTANANTVAAVMKAPKQTPAVVREPDLVDVSVAKSASKREKPASSEPEGKRLKIPRARDGNPSTSALPHGLS
mmetsp:Transcript_793/g.2294  ORF Transcript_793/g.2294 Transcript_793/m.2294 type:complete len:415 (-) Transcript_793:174-1418(-)